MGTYLNKIGLLKYNNSTYKPVGEPQYYSVKDPGLVSSDPNVNFFNYPWKSDEHWSYNHYGQGWFYNGKDEISYTVPINGEDIKSYDPTSPDNTLTNEGFVYNVIPIHQSIVSESSEEIESSTLTSFSKQYYILESLNETVTENGVEKPKIYKIKYNNDYRAYIKNGDNIDPTSYTYMLITSDNQEKYLVLNWSPDSADIDGNWYETPYVTGYWNEGGTICGYLKRYPNLNQGNINDLFSNELTFYIKSPNLNNVDESTLTDNQVRGLFTSVPGTNYITGICTTKMLFIDNNNYSDPNVVIDQSKKQYVYMRGLFKGNLNFEDDVLANDIITPSTIIRKIKITNLKGTLKNISDLPQEIKFNINHYYAWGWLYGIDNISYSNIWYKNEISGVLTSDMAKLTNNLNGINYQGKLSTTIITNDGTDDIINIMVGNFVKEEEKNIITGFLQGVIKPFDIQMKGYVSGYYNVINKQLIPIQLSGILYNKSVIGNDLKQVLDIKYANILGRKELAYKNSLYGQNLNYASKNYDPFNKPYMLQTWKIIEYKTSNEEIDYKNTLNLQNSVDLNTYIVNKKSIHKTYTKDNKEEKELQKLINEEEGKEKLFNVYWDRDETTGQFVIRCYERSTQIDSIEFSSVYNAQKYIKHLCTVSNLKIKKYIVSDNIPLTSYILDSSDLEIK